MLGLFLAIGAKEKVTSLNDINTTVTYFIRTMLVHIKLFGISVIKAESDSARLA